MKISVVTPVLNAESTISECIESVSAQSYNDIEHIVVDGDSTDKTVEIARRYGVRCVSEKDVGVYDAFNRGVALASGDVVHILNADDMYAADTVVEQMITEVCDRQLDICHGLAEQFDATGKVVKTIGGSSSKSSLLKKMRVAHPATFVRKSVYDKFGAFSVGFKIAADQEFLLRVWEKVGVGFTPLVVTRMRIGGVSTSNVNLSYRESMAAAVLHGVNPIKATSRYYLELLKARLPGVQPRA